MLNTEVSAPECNNTDDYYPNEDCDSGSTGPTLKEQKISVIGVSADLFVKMADAGLQIPVDDGTPAARTVSMISVPRRCMLEHTVKQINWITNGSPAAHNWQKLKFYLTIFPGHAEICEYTYRTWFKHR